MTSEKRSIKNVLCKESNLTIKFFIEKLVYDLSKEFSIEYFLAKLSSLISKLNILCENDPECIQDCLRIIVESNSIKKLASQLGEAILDIDTLIDRDRKFEVLKPHREMLKEIFSRIIGVERSKVMVAREEHGKVEKISIATIDFKTLIEPYIRRLIAGLEGGKTAEWYLIKLSSLVSQLKDFCEFYHEKYGAQHFASREECLTTLLRYVLEHNDIKRYMSYLKFGKDYALSKIDSDPRFVALRPYKNLLSKYLDSLPGPPVITIPGESPQPEQSIERAPSPEGKEKKSESTAIKEEALGIKPPETETKSKSLIQIPIKENITIALKDLGWASIINIVSSIMLFISLLSININLNTLETFLSSLITSPSSPVFLVSIIFALIATFTKLIPGLRTLIEQKKEAPLDIYYYYLTIIGITVGIIFISIATLVSMISPKEFLNSTVDNLIS